MSVSAPNPSLLAYRTFTERRRGPWWGALAIARTSLMLLARRRLFWTLYVCSVLIFLFYFFGQYLQVFLENRVSETMVRTGGLFGRMISPDAFVKALSGMLRMNGTADTYGDFMWTEGYIAMVILSFAGSVLIGNDFQHNSLPFYLAKPISRRHYLAGKALAIAFVMNAISTVPALGLYFQYGFIGEWSYYLESWQLLAGILVYGITCTVTMSLLLLVTATWVRKTVPLVMVWTALFVLARLVHRWLVDGLELSPRWRLIDIWNDMYLFGQWVFGTPHDTLRPRNQIQPEYGEAALAVVVVCVACVLYLRRRVRAVEVVT